MNKKWQCSMLKQISSFTVVTIASLLASFLVCAKSLAENNLVVVVYHHVSIHTPATTSISPDTFKSHVEYMVDNHNVVALPEALAAIKAGQSLPAKAIAITFDDGFADIFENGHPILKQYDLPYTVFINPSVIDVQANQLSWQQVKLMQSENVTFANHTMDHLHLLDRLPSESQQDWQNRIWQNIEQAERQITQQTGVSLKMLAYPFGEYDSSIQAMLAQAGYIGLGQHSGAINSNSDFTALPRFPAAGRYANLKTLKTKLASLAYARIESSVTNPDRGQNRQFPDVTLTIDEPDTRLKQVSCFYQGNTLPLTVSHNTISFKHGYALPVGRSRVNCTAPSKQQPGRYYWYSQPFFIADDQGHYPD